MSLKLYTHFSRNRSLLLIFSAILVGLIFILYDLTLLKKLGPGNYQPFLYFDVTDTVSYQSHYGVITREGIEGKILPGDGVVKENQEKLIHLPTLKAFIPGFIGHLLGLSLFQTYLLSKFFFGIFLTLISFFLLYKFTNSYLLSLTGSFSLPLGMDLLFDRYTLVPQVFKWIASNLADIFVWIPDNYHANNFIELSRYPDMMFPLSIFLLTLYLTHNFFQNSRDTTWDFIKPALGITALAYLQLHYFLSIVGLYGFFFLKSLIEKDKKMMIKIVKTILLTFILSLPFISYLLTFYSPEFAYLKARGGFFEHRKAYIDMIAILGLILTFLLPKKNLVFYLFLFLNLSAIIGMNSQLLLGFDLKESHWSFRVIRPLIFLAVFILLAQFEKIKKAKLLPLAASSMLILLLLANSIFMQISYAQVMLPRYQQLNEKYLPHFNWLEKNTREDEVILAGFDTSILLPLYTSLYLYLAPGYSISTDAEIIDRLAIFFALLNVDENKIQSLLHEEMPQLYLFNGKYRDSGIVKNIVMPEEVVQEIMEKTAYYKSSSIDAALGKYEIDYLYIGPQEKELLNTDLSRYYFLKPIYNKKAVTIYKVNLPSKIPQLPAIK